MFWTCSVSKQHHAVAGQARAALVSSHTLAKLLHSTSEEPFAGSISSHCARASLNVVFLKRIGCRYELFKYFASHA
tara:strand:- start:164 stop:391 length:228 start_codon:yes stop_codon:yes gene_type:complete